MNYAPFRRARNSPIPHLTVLCYEVAARGIPSKHGPAAGCSQGAPAAGRALHATRRRHDDGRGRAAAHASRTKPLASRGIPADTAEVLLVPTRQADHALVERSSRRTSVVRQVLGTFFKELEKICGTSYSGTTFFSHELRGASTWRKR